ncbi:unnamed protein product [Mytilus coruscus]|uniref:PIF1 n=1 Tax=Mytilus coruscus TaxID=42192 RepID=A0A6J8BDF9_MYTCO|nr:unnamed protein product [Mytilus coruscus]
MACAKTVHRSQGDTMQSAVLQLPSKKLAHLHYVAFSRVTALQNIHISGKLDPSKITVSQDVKSEMYRLRTDAQLQQCYSPLYNLDNCKMKIYFHNCQSIHLHIEDIKKDESIFASDVCLFVETKLCASDKNNLYEMENFNMYRNDYHNNRTAYGSSVYIKKNIYC